MAEKYTRFAPVDTGANGTIKNGLPLKNAVTAFQYRKRIDSFVSFGAFDTTVGTGYKTITGNWKIQIKAYFGGPILFEQEVTVRFFVEIQLIAGVIGFFFWYIQDFKTETTICDAKVVPFDASGNLEGWRFVDYPNPTINAETGPDADVRTGDFDDITDDLRATGTFTAEGGVIDACFQSAPYKCNLPVGAVLEVVFDHWQFAHLREATYSFAFKGSAHFSALWDRVGAFRTARGLDGGTLLEHRFPGAASIYSVPRARAFFPGVNNACIVKTPDNALWILGNEATKGRLWLSEDDGTTRTRVSHTVNGVKEDLLVFGDGFEIIDLKAAPTDGTMWSLASKDGVLYLSSSRDDWLRNITLGRAKSPPYSMGISHDGTILVASATHEFEYDGNTVNERPPLSTPALSAT